MTTEIKKIQQSELKLSSNYFQIKVDEKKLFTKYAIKIKYLLKGFSCFKASHYVYVGYIIHTCSWILCNDEIVEVKFYFWFNYYRI
jgi:hypothetical protein